MHYRLTTIAALLTFSFLLQSCQSIDEGFVARDWSNKLRELNIHPVFPPREDFQVGDVYLLPTNPKNEEAEKKKGFLPIGVWINTINLTSSLKTHYKTRPDFPVSSSKIALRPEIETQPTSADNAIFSHGKLNRLKMVAFPAFFTAEISSFDAATMIPTSALSGLGLSSSNIKKASVTITSAESYGIPVSKLSNANKPLFMGKELCINNITGMNANSLGLVVDGNKDANANTANLLIITEVFYARTLKVLLHTDKTFNTGNNANATTSTQPNLVNKVITGSGKAPGVTFSFSSSASGTASIDQSYERPIAVGYRGIRRKIYLDAIQASDNSKCQVIQSSAIDADLPTVLTSPPAVK